MAVQRPPRYPSEAETVSWLERGLEAKIAGGFEALYGFSVLKTIAIKHD